MYGSIIVDIQAVVNETRYGCQDRSRNISDRMQKVRQFFRDIPRLETLACNLYVRRTERITRPQKSVSLLRRSGSIRVQATHLLLADKEHHGGE
jgi:hypothetical protein